jgi:hypothetical protein
MIDVMIYDTWHDMIDIMMWCDVMWCDVMWCDVIYLLTAIG